MHMCTYVFTCVWTYLCVEMHVYVYVCGGPRLTSRISISLSPYSFLNIYYSV